MNSCYFDIFEKFVCFHAIMRRFEGYVKVFDLKALRNTVFIVVVPPGLK